MGYQKFNLMTCMCASSVWRIAEQGGRGVVCYIGNSSYVREPSIVVMREHLTNNFNRIWIDNLNGDSPETGKTTPDGLPPITAAVFTLYNKASARERQWRCSSNNPPSIKLRRRKG